MSFAATGMELEILVLSEVRKRQTNTYNITYLWTQKYGTDFPIYKTETDNGHEGQTCVCQGRGVESRAKGEFGDGVCRLLHLEQMGDGVTMPNAPKPMLRPYLYLRV